LTILDKNSQFYLIAGNAFAGNR